MIIWTEIVIVAAVTIAAVVLVTGLVSWLLFGFNSMKARKEIAEKGWSVGEIKDMNAFEALLTDAEEHPGKYVKLEEMIANMKLRVEGYQKIPIELSLTAEQWFDMHSAIREKAIGNPMSAVVVTHLQTAMEEVGVSYLWRGKVKNKND